jgi:hypothetical protein
MRPLGLFDHLGKNRRGDQNQRLLGYPDLALPTDEANRLSM